MPELPLRRCCTRVRPGERGVSTHRDLKGPAMNTPTLFPPTELDPRIVVATAEPEPRDTRALDAAHDVTPLFSRIGFGPITLREVAPPTGEFVEYLFAEWCDEEITKWAKTNLDQIAALRAEVYTRLVGELDTLGYMGSHSAPALMNGTSMRELIARSLENETKQAACAAIYAAVAERART